MSTTVPKPKFADPLTSHLGFVSERTGSRSASAWIEIRDDLRDSRGRLHAGVLSYLVDAAAGVACGMAARPAWVVTADVQLEIVRLPTRGPVRADAVVRRPGRRQSCGEVIVYNEDALDEVVAVGTVNHIVVPDDSVGDHVPTDMPVGIRFGPALPPAKAARHITDVVGLHVADGGGLAIPIEGVAVNPLGFLHGGLTGLLVVESAAAHGFDVSALTLRFLGPLKDQTATASSTLIGATQDRPLLQADIQDATGRPATAATARLAHTPA